MACPPIAKLQSICLRLKSAVTRRRYREAELKRRSIKISAPFNFQHIMQGSPSGMNEDEKESVRDTHLLISRRVNVLLGKTAATRMIPIEDQPRPPSSSTSSFFNNSSQTTFVPSAASTASQIRPKTSMKTRAGYRGLASSSAANGGRGLAYSPMAVTETLPSITHSFAATDDTYGSVSTPDSFVTHSTASTSPTRHEQRGMSI